MYVLVSMRYVEDLSVPQTSECRAHHKLLFALAVVFPACQPFHLSEIPKII